MPARSIIYVDGFNLYYGAVRGTTHKWLNLQQLFERLRPHDCIQRIYYFTAEVTGPHAVNQRAYLRALATNPLVQILFGKFKRKQLTCRVVGCDYARTRVFSAVEEKRTDVNIATQMLSDAFRDQAERLILVSGDSDLVPAVNMIKSEFPKKQVIVYVPARNPIRGAAAELRTAADKHKTLPMTLVRVSQFPATLPDGTGGSIDKPPDW